MIFRVAVLQKRAVNKEISDNIDTIISNMKTAANQSADLLLLPECL